MDTKGLTGRYLSLPIGHADWKEKLTWFGHPEFTDAQKTGFQPAIEWKGQMPSSEIVAELRSRNIYWGLHASTDFADLSHNNWGKYRAIMERIARLQPHYVVVHGGLNSLMPMTEIRFDDPIARYRSPIGAREFIVSWNHQCKMLLDMAHLMRICGGGEVLLENTSITEFVEATRLPTYTHPRVGNWVEVTKIAKSAGCKPLCDIGHLTYSHNFFQRQEDYSELPGGEAYEPRSDDEKILWHQLGLGIRRGEFPVVHRLIDLPKAIEAISADHYHIEAGQRDESMVGGTIATHAPIEMSDQRIRGILMQLLQRENCLLCLEIDGSKPNGGGPFPDRPSTELLQRLSWENLCRMCVEILP